jgi:hypothetical protein
MRMQTVVGGNEELVSAHAMSWIAQTAEKTSSKTFKSMRAAPETMAAGL